MLTRCSEEIQRRRKEGHPVSRRSSMDLYLKRAHTHKPHSQLEHPPASGMDRVRVGTVSL